MAEKTHNNSIKSILSRAKDFLFDKEAYGDDLKGPLRQMAGYFGGSASGMALYYACGDSNNHLIQSSNNVFEAFSPYCILRMVGIKKVPSAIASFVVASACEFGQLPGGFYGGTFDPQDFLKYAMGISIALGADLAISRFRNRKKKSQRSLETKCEPTSEPVVVGAN